MRDSRVVAVLVGLVLVALIPSLPYGYYSVMRWIVSASCAWLALSAHRQGAAPWVWYWAIVAGIYNPIVPVHASRAVWSVVNIGTVLVASVYLFRSKPRNA